eukprot:143277-Chlamydomonas_euryale.AAC.1
MRAAEARHERETARLRAELHAAFAAGSEGTAEVRRSVDALVRRVGSKCMTRTGLEPRGEADAAIDAPVASSRPSSRRAAGDGSGGGGTGASGPEGAPLSQRFAGMDKEVEELAVAVGEAAGRLEALERSTLQEFPRYAKVWGGRFRSSH